MQIKWTSVEKALPNEGEKVYISDGDSLLAAQAYYHAGMYWQDANQPTQRYALGRIIKWCTVDHAQEVIDNSVAKADEYKDHSLRYTPTEALERFAEAYARKHWDDEDTRRAAYWGFISGYCEVMQMMNAGVLSDE